MSQVKNLTLGGKNSGEIFIQISINLKVYRPKNLPKFSFEGGGVVFKESFIDRVAFLKDRVLELKMTLF